MQHKLYVSAVEMLMKFFSHSLVVLFPLTKLTLYGRQTRFNLSMYIEPFSSRTMRPKFSDRLHDQIAAGTGK